MQVLIADDHDLVREGINSVLKQFRPDVNVIQCRDFEEAVKGAEQAGTVDLVILDLNMPGMNGTLGIEQFRERVGDTPVLILSGQYQRQDVLDALQSGAAGFLPKCMDNEALVSALRLVLAGERFIPSEILFDSDGKSGRHWQVEPSVGKEENFQLSRREYHVLSELIEGLSNKVIAANLGIEEVTVKLHLRNIYRKIGASSRTHAVKIAYERGLHQFEPARGVDECRLNRRCMPGDPILKN